MRLHVLDLNSSGPWTGFVVPRDVNKLARLFFLDFNPKTDLSVLVLVKQNFLFENSQY
jgi:hypothetical protein